MKKKHFAPFANKKANITMIYRMRLMFPAIETDSTFLASEGRAQKSPDSDLLTVFPSF